MTDKIDLHTHSNASDGTLSPVVIELGEVSTGCVPYEVLEK